MQNLIFVFPIAVTALAALSLALGLPIAAWQWWAATCGCGLLLAFCSWRETKNARKLAIDVALFAAILAVFKLLVSTPVFLQDFDGSICHVPAVRLLADGWNPVYESTPEAIERAFNLDTSTMRIWHLLSMPKAVWYFNAAAYRFFGNDYAMMLPILPFMALALAISLWRFFNGRAFIAVPAILLAFYIMPFRCNFFVTDNTVAIAGTGFLLGLVRRLRGEDGRSRGLALELFTWAFWMAASKPAGILHVIVWYAIFCIWRFWKSPVRAKPEFHPGILLFAALLAVVWISPYWSMWREYGHAFYPSATADAAKHPAMDLTEDFFDRNRDADSMSWPERYAYSWISPDAVKWCRAKFKNEPNFKPFAEVWKLETDGTAPTRPHARLMLWGMMLFLLIFGKTGSRMVVLCIFTGITALPPQYLGYLRYTPWLYAPLLVLSLERLADLPHKKTIGAMLSAIAVCAFAMRAPVFLEAYRAKGKIEAILRKNPEIRIYSRHPGTNFDLALYELRRRHIPEWRNVQIETGADPKNPELAIFFDGSCLVEKDKLLKFQ